MRFLSFAFLSFAFLSFAFLSFAFLSFALNLAQFLVLAFDFALTFALNWAMALDILYF